jgi:hypothetical protein
MFGFGLGGSALEHYAAAASHTAHLCLTHQCTSGAVTQACSAVCILTTDLRSFQLLATQLPSQCSSLCACSSTAAFLTEGLSIMKAVLADRKSLP